MSDPATRDQLGLFDALAGDGRPLLLLAAAFLAGCGLFGIMQASTPDPRERAEIDNIRDGSRPHARHDW